MTDRLSPWGRRARDRAGARNAAHDLLGARGSRQGLLIASGPMAAMLFGLVIAGCGDAGPTPAHAAADSTQATAPAPAGPPAMGVEVAVARQDVMVTEVSVTGRIEAVHAIELRPEVEGRVVQVHVREGQPVAAGAPLFKIDDAELRAQIARATAERDLARQTLERTRQLMAQNASAQADLERAEALARGAQAQLDVLTVRLARTTVRAPFAGVAGQRLVSLGDYVSPQTKLVSLQTTNPQRVVLHVPERYAADVRAGQVVRFGIAAFPADSFAAKVEFVDPVVALPARTITVKALAANPGNRLRPGMFAEARVATSVRPTAIVVPEEALMPAPGGRNAVWVIADGKAARRDVAIGVRRAGLVEIASGVAAGEQVVVGGLLQLSEGAPVTTTLVGRSAN